MQHPLYFIALLPDLEIQQEVTAFKQECAVQFNASHALKSPPHITLIPPFRWNPKEMEKLKLSLVDFAFDQLSFSIYLNGFASFPPRVLFVDVEQNETLVALQSDLLKHLQQQLHFKNKNAQRFHPHMTIAHRDLEEAVFPTAWAYFSKIKYERQCLAGDLVLLQHINRKWEILERFDFG